MLGKELRAKTLKGFPFIKEMGLLSTAVSTVTKIQSSNEEGKFTSASSKIIENYRDVFEGLGKLNTVHKIRLKPNAAQYACAPRSVPCAI